MGDLTKEESGGSEHREHWGDCHLSSPLLEGSGREGEGAEEGRANYQGPGGVEAHQWDFPSSNRWRGMLEKRGVKGPGPPSHNSTAG